MTYDQQSSRVDIFVKQFFNIATCVGFTQLKCKQTVAFPQCLALGIVVVCK